MSRVRLACLFALCLAGCESVGPSAPPLVAPAPPPPPPPPVEFSAILGDGAFHTPAGAHATCAGQSVALMIDNPRSRARMLALYGSATHAMAPISLVKARAAKVGPTTENFLVNSTQCGPDGRFGFSGLQSGGYLLIARVRLDRPQAGQDQFVVLQAVSLRVGETQPIRLAP